MLNEIVEIVYECAQRLGSWVNGDKELLFDLLSFFSAILRPQKLETRRQCSSIINLLWSAIYPVTAFTRDLFKIYTHKKSSVPESI